MLPTEQGKFFEAVTRSLSAYGRFPEQRDLEAWWHECRSMTLEGLEAALKSHRDDPDRGERAPRPVDITRRMKTGSRNAQQCAAVDHTGRCEYLGIFSDGTSGEGPWYCPWHREDRASEESSRWIEVSRRVRWDDAHAKRTARMAEEAQRAPTVATTRERMRTEARGNLAKLLGRYQPTDAPEPAEAE